MLYPRVFVRTPAGRQRYNILAAINSHTHDFIGVRSRENITSHSVVALIDRVSEKHQEQPVTLVMDNARYQRCHFVTDHARDKGAELLFLPAYTPNLNLIERSWKLTKRPCLTYRYYENFD